MFTHKDTEIIMQQATENNNKDSGEWTVPIVVIKTTMQ